MLICTGGVVGLGFGLAVWAGASVGSDSKETSETREK